MNYVNYALVFKALGDETRLRIIHLLSDKELCACELLNSFNITQPTLSYHMKLLVDCQLVTPIKSGSWVRYKINHIMEDDVIKFLENGEVC